MIQPFPRKYREHHGDNEKQNIFINLEIAFLLASIDYKILKVHRSIKISLYPHLGLLIVIVITWESGEYCRKYPINHIRFTCYNSFNSGR